MKVLVDSNYKTACRALFCGGNWLGLRFLVGLKYNPQPPVIKALLTSNLVRFGPVSPDPWLGQIAAVLGPMGLEWTHFGIGLDLVHGLDWAQFLGQVQGLGWARGQFCAKFWTGFGLILCWSVCLFQLKKEHFLRLLLSWFDGFMGFKIELQEGHPGALLNEKSSYIIYQSGFL